MVESDHGVLRASHWVFACPDSDPVQLAANSVPFRFPTPSADPYDRVELPCANLAHATTGAKSALVIRVALVGPLVDKGSHRSSCLVLSRFTLILNRCTALD